MPSERPVRSGYRNLLYVADEADAYMDKLEAENTWMRWLLKEYWEQGPTLGLHDRVAAFFTTEETTNAE